MALGHDVADAAFRAAETGMFFPVLHIETVVEGQLLALGDVAPRGDPDVTAHVFTFAVRLAGMVDEPRGVPSHVAVEIVALVDLKDVNATVATSRGSGGTSRV